MRRWCVAVAWSKGEDAADLERAVWRVNREHATLDVLLECLPAAVDIAKAREENGDELVDGKPHVERALEQLAIAAELIG